MKNEKWKKATIFLYNVPVHAVALCSVSRPGLYSLTTSLDQAEMNAGTTDVSLYNHYSDSPVTDYTHSSREN